MNVVLKSSAGVRNTVAGIVVRPAEPHSLIAVHWPEKAAQAGEGNLATAQGYIKPNEAVVSAMDRHLRSEYRIDGARITQLSHPRFNYSGKQYHWCLAVVDSGPSPGVSEREVADFGWCASPEQLFVIINEMHDNKRRMFLHALDAARIIEPKMFASYTRAFSARRQRKLTA